MNHPKIRLTISPTCVDCSTIYQIIRSKYDIVYCGIHTLNDEFYVYLHNRERMASNVIMKILSGIVDITDVSKFTEIEGEVLDNIGTVLKHGGSRKRKRRKVSKKPSTIINNSTTINNDNRTINNTNNNINLIMVNPIGMESLEHITPEFIQELLAEHHGPDVVFRFGTKMYSLQENMNFKTDVKSGFISGRTDMDDAWETRRKNEGFSMLLDNLKDKNEEAVLKYLETIPHDDLDQFKRDMWWIYEHKNSGLQEDVPVYQKFIRDGFNLLTANIADKKRRIERDTGKKLKLV